MLEVSSSESCDASPCDPPPPLSGDANMLHLPVNAANSIAMVNAGASQLQAPIVAG
jgi:hypothetical protein